MSDPKITVVKGGPLKIEGRPALCDPEGGVIETRADKPAYFLCRCGASENKPFCDGSHKQVDFE